VPASTSERGIFERSCSYAGRVAFHIGDTIDAGMVERIVPDNWQPDSELIPAIHVLKD